MLKTDKDKLPNESCHHTKWDLTPKIFTIIKLYANEMKIKEYFQNLE